MVAAMQVVVLVLLGSSIVSLVQAASSSKYPDVILPVPGSEARSEKFLDFLGGPEQGKGAHYYVLAPKNEYTRVSGIAVLPTDASGFKGRVAELAFAVVITDKIRWLRSMDIGVACDAGLGHSILEATHTGPGADGKIDLPDQDNKDDTWQNFRNTGPSKTGWLGFWNANPDSIGIGGQTERFPDATSVALDVQVDPATEVIIASFTFHLASGATVIRQLTPPHNPFLPEQPKFVNGQDFAFMRFMSLLPDKGLVGDKDECVGAKMEGQFKGLQLFKGGQAYPWNKGRIYAAWGVQRKYIEKIDLSGTDPTGDVFITNQELLCPITQTPQNKPKADKQQQQQGQKQSAGTGAGTGSTQGALSPVLAVGQVLDPSTDSSATANAAITGDAQGATATGSALPGQGPWHGAVTLPTATPRTSPAASPTISQGILQSTQALQPQYPAGTQATGTRRSSPTQTPSTAVASLTPSTTATLPSASPSAVLDNTTQLNSSDSMSMLEAIDQQNKKMAQDPCKIWGLGC